MWIKGNAIATVLVAKPDISRQFSSEQQTQVVYNQQHSAVCKTVQTLLRGP